MTFSLSKVINGTLLVAGTATGAGMLALPVATAAGGFWPAFFMYVLCWIFMSGTGLLLLEVCCWMPHDANMVTMAGHIFGKKGKTASWILYLFLFYSLTVAYVAGGGGFFTAIANDHLTSWQGTALFVLVFGSIVYLGTKAIHRINYLLMAGLIVTYLLFVVLGWDRVDTQLLKPMNWFQGILALPVIFTAFSYQGIVPSLSAYMARNTRMLRLAILIGTAIPLLAYIIWEFLILGIVPIEGPMGLLTAKMEGQTAVYPLKYFINSPYIYMIGQFFAFFALTTSFLGVTLGLVDFLADGLQVKKEGWRRVWLCLLVFLPPMVVAINNPTIFIIALTYAGGIGCALLLGLLPTLMVWKGRYKLELLPKKRQLPGGKGLLVIFVLFVIFELSIELYQEFIRIMS